MVPQKKRPPDKRRPHDSYPDDPPRKSLRLTFRYEGQSVQLVAAKRVAMTPPPSEPLGAQEPRSGFRLELSTQRGRVLYRRFGTNPIQTSAEAPSDDPERPFQRVTVKSRTGEFDVVVPDMEGAVRLELLGDVSVEGTKPAVPETRGVVRVASVDLRDLPNAREMPK
jgi:hypothetical protein